MRKSSVATALALVASLAAFGCTGSRADEEGGHVLNIPGLPPIPLPPGARVFGPNGPMPDAVPGPSIRPTPPPAVSGHPPAVPGSGSRAGAAAPPAGKRPDRKEQLDLLFGRLAKAADPDEAQGLVAAIEHLWMRSGSDTADLLMTRAVTAMGSDHRDVALLLLDKLIALRPNWAEAWNKRATLRFLDDDDADSMADISHVLALEPRHFGALSGMGVILQRNGLNKAALAAFRRALEIDPADAIVQKLVDQLVPQVEGRDL